MPQKLEDTANILNGIKQAFEEFKIENDKRIKQIEKGEYPDPILEEKIDKINAEVAKYSAMKRDFEKMEEKMAVLSSPIHSTATNDSNFENKKKHRDAFHDFFRNGNIASNIRELEIKADLRTSSDPDGGFLVPDELDATIERVTTVVSAMRRVASVVTAKNYKKIVNLGGADSGWVGETDPRPKTGTPQLSEISIPPHTVYANPYTTQDLLDDADIDIEAWLADEVAIVFAEAMGEKFINGDGVKVPRGITQYPLVANASYVWGKIGFVKSGTAADLDNADAIIDLQHALRQSYRPMARWMMNDFTMSRIRKLKDDYGQYLWSPGLTMGTPDTLLGKPIEIDDNLPDIGENTYPLWFADWARAYKIADVPGTMVLRDPYTQKPYVQFYTTKRTGGGIIMFEAIKAMKIAA